MSKITKLDERQQAQLAYDKALGNMLANPTQESIKAFGEANARLFEVEDSYRIAARLLLERAQRVIRAIFGLDHLP